MPGEPTSITLSAADAIWDALEASSDYLANVFQAKEKFRDVPGGMSWYPNPSIGDMPAIAISTQGVSAPWKTNQNKHLTLRVLVEFWTREWHEQEAMAIYEEWHRMMYQRFDPGGGIVDRVVEIGEMTPERLELIDPDDNEGGPRATKWSFGMTLLAGKFNPRLPAA